MLAAHFRHDLDPDDFKRLTRRLAQEDLAAIEKAIQTCFDQCKYFPTQAEILERMPAPSLRKRFIIFTNRELCRAAELSGMHSTDDYACGCGVCNPKYWCQFENCPRPHAPGDVYCLRHSSPERRSWDQKEAQIAQRKKLEEQKSSGWQKVSTGGRTL